MKKEEDVDPTIHYAALRWFYLLYVFSKRIVYNLATYKRYPTTLPRLHYSSSAVLSSSQEVLSAPWEGSNCQCSQPRAKIQLCFHVQIPSFKTIVSWPSPAWKHMVSLVLSLFKKGNFSHRKLLSKSATAFICSVQSHLPSLCSQVHLCLHTTCCRSRYFHLFPYP